MFQITNFLLMNQANIPFVVYSESTPNPASMKFVANHLLAEGTAVEYNKNSNLTNSPIAVKLFHLPFVSGIFISGNFITITKNESVEWAEVVNEVRCFIQDYLREGNKIFNTKEKSNRNLSNSNNIPNTDIPILNPENLELNQKISNILDEYIKPGVESDGGAIDFKSFQKGIVTVTLRGACSGCPSSTVTLKAGIESVLKRLVPEVKEVVAQEL